MTAVVVNAWYAGRGVCSRAAVWCVGQLDYGNIALKRTGSEAAYVVTVGVEQAAMS